jgi:hypothetical protein
MLDSYLESNRLKKYICTGNCLAISPLFNAYYYGWYIQGFRELIKGSDESLKLKWLAVGEIPDTLLYPDFLFFKLISGNGDEVKASTWFLRLTSVKNSCRSYPLQTVKKSGSLVLHFQLMRLRFMT